MNDPKKVSTTIGLVSSPVGAFVTVYIVSQDGVLALVVAVLTFILAAAVAFNRDVWGRSYKRFTERIAMRLERRLFDERAAKRNYRKQLIRSIRYDSPEGVNIPTPVSSLDLMNIYVRLHIVIQSTEEARRLVTEEKLHTLQDDYIWSFLERTQGNFAISGVPGSGKSTLLKNLALTLCEPSHRKSEEISDKIPDITILIRYRDHGDAIVANPKVELKTLVREHIFGNQPDLFDETWFDDQLKNGKCLILFDGLDEIPDEARREKVVEWTTLQMNDWADNRFIVTARPGGFKLDDEFVDFPNAIELEILPFNRNQQREFVEKWYREHLTAIRRKEIDPEELEYEIETQTESLLKQVHSSYSISILAVNPLLLHMLALTHAGRENLPKTRVDLYEDIFELLLFKRSKRREVEDKLKRGRKRELLQELAFAMMKSGKATIEFEDIKTTLTTPLAKISDISVQDFLDIIEMGSGVFGQRSEGVYGFAHKTFQEYLTATYLKDGKATLDILKDNIANEWWHQTIVLYCAMTDASPIIQACLNSEPLSIEVLSLAIECQQEADEIHSDVDNRLKNILETDIEHKDVAYRKLVAEALLKYRLRHFNRESDEKEIDPTFVTHAEYQLFLDDMLEKNIIYIPEHWVSTRFPAGSGNEPVAGVWGGEAQTFCEWLTARDDKWQYRLPYKGEIRENNKAMGYWFQQRSQLLLEKPDQIEANIATLCQDKWNSDQGESEIVFTGTYSVSILFYYNSSYRTLARTSLDNIFILGLAHTLDITLARTLDIALARDRYLASALARDLALASALTRKLIIIRDLASDLAFAIASDLTIALASAFDLTHDLDHASEHARDLAFTLSHDRDLARAIASDLARVFFIASALSNNQVLDTNDHALKIAQYCTSALQKALYLLIVDRLPDVYEHFREGRLKREMFQVMRLEAKAGIDRELEILHSSTILQRNQKAGAEKKIERLKEEYATAVILEARLDGKLKAYEGIRLVRRRKLS